MINLTFFKSFLFSLIWFGIVLAYMLDIFVFKLACCNYYAMTYVNLLNWSMTFFKFMETTKTHGKWVEDNISNSENYGNHRELMKFSKEIKLPQYYSLSFFNHKCDYDKKTNSKMWEDNKKWIRSCPSVDNFNMMWSGHGWKLRQKFWQAKRWRKERENYLNVDW